MALHATEKPKVCTSVRVMYFSVGQACSRSSKPISPSQLPRLAAERVLKERLVERRMRPRGSLFRSQCGSRAFAKGHIKIVSELADLVW